MMMRGQSRCRAAGDRGLEEKRKTAAPEAGRLGRGRLQTGRSLSTPAGRQKERRNASLFGR